MDGVGTEEEARMGSSRRCVDTRRGYRRPSYVRGGDVGKIKASREEGVDEQETTLQSKGKYREDKLYFFFLKHNRQRCLGRYRCGRDGSWAKSGGIATRDKN